MNTSLKSLLGLKSSAFTLVEVVVSMSIFLLLAVLFVTVINGVQQTWLHGGQKVEAYQNGRAILEMMSRELAPAIVSSNYQFVQSPKLSTVVTGAPANPAAATNAPSLFWVAPNVSSTNGDICEFGYYLTRKPATTGTAAVYALNRFFVPADDTHGFYLTGTAAIVTGTTAEFIVPRTTALQTRMRRAFNINLTGSNAVTTVAEGVVAMWVRCYDHAGNPIPWLGGTSSSFYPTVAPVQFNSAASFQMTSADAPFMAGASALAADSATFQYTLPGSTGPANQLPGSVEITIVVVDSKALARNPRIPDMAKLPCDGSPLDIPEQVDAFNTALISAGVKSARTLSTRVKLLNATP